MWVTLNPREDMAERTVGGGAAPAVITLIVRGRGRIVSPGGALIRVLRTTGAAQKCVTPRLAMAENTARAVTCRKISVLGFGIKWGTRVFSLPGGGKCWCRRERRESR